MERDLVLLSTVSKLFTEDTLKEILRKATCKDDVTVSGWTFEDPGTKGDSYMSQIDRVTVFGEAGGEEAAVKLVVKSLPKNIGRRKTFRSTDFFYNEVTFYNEVVPVLKKFVESKSQKSLFSTPACLSAMTDGENDYLALEDVGILGFEPVTRNDRLDLEQMDILLRAMANFHAVSFAYKDQYPEEFRRLADKLVETYFGEGHWGFYKNYRVTLARVAGDALTKEYPGHPATEKFNSEPPRILWERSSSLCKRWHAPTSVIDQGDAWAPNFLIRKVADETEALLLDFQVARVASPVLDLSFLIYCCGDEQLVDGHFDEMLKTYHSTLSRAIKALGSDPEKVYPWYLFQEEVKEYSCFGVSCALEAVPFTVLEDSEVFDLDSIIKGDEAVDMAEALPVENIKTPAGRRRLAGLIIHAYSRGFL